MGITVHIKLMGLLKAKAPGQGSLDLSDGATIDDVLQCLDIDSKTVQIVMVNSKPQGDRSYVLSADDELTILPPVGGG